MATKPLCPLCRAGIGRAIELYRGTDGFENRTFQCTNCEESWTKFTAGSL